MSENKDIEHIDLSDEQKNQLANWDFYLKRDESGQYSIAYVAPNSRWGGFDGKLKNGLQEGDILVMVMIGCGASSVSPEDLDKVQPKSGGFYEFLVKRNGEYLKGKAVFHDKKTQRRLS